MVTEAAYNNDQKDLNFHKCGIAFIFMLLLSIPWARENRVHAWKLRRR